MVINLIGIIVVIILAGLAYYANEQLNNVPILKNIVRVLIVVVSVLLIMQNMGLISGIPIRIG